MKQIITVVLHLFDVEFGKLWNEGYLFNPRNIGIMGPKRDPVVRLRRRRL